MKTSSPARGLYAIVSPPLPGDDDTRFLRRVQAIVAGGAARLQLRIKDPRDDRARLALIERVLRHCRDGGVPLLVNDRVDLAFAAGADGVHVGDRDLPPPFARKVLGPAALVGTSTHSVAQLVQADRDGGACHLALGPVWASPTKSGHADVTGVDVLRQACAATTLPVVAIGGITTEERARQAVAAGATFVAVVSALEGDDADVVFERTSAFSRACATAETGHAVDGARDRLP
jgi:thiamine-phosphate pyrophosphorylase